MDQLISLSTVRCLTNPDKPSDRTFFAVQVLSRFVRGQRRLRPRRAMGQTDRADRPRLRRVAAQWLTFTNKSYDLVYTED